MVEIDLALHLWHTAIDNGDVVIYSAGCQIVTAQKKVTLMSSGAESMPAVQPAPITARPVVTILGKYLIR